MEINVEKIQPAGSVSQLNRGVSTIKTKCTIMTGKRNAKVKFCHVLHVAHNYELLKLTMTRIWSHLSGLF